jgi:glycosyltransferase involved in cell wall biosynthesis
MTLAVNTGVNQTATLPPRVPEIVALFHVFNEELILEATLAHLAAQGIGAYVMDNGSTDDTVAIAQSFRGRGVVGIERFPEVMPAERPYDLASLLRRKAQLAVELRRRGARWCMHYDADEIRQSPWPGVSLAEGLRLVKRAGYNAVDHVVVSFVPTDEDFRRGMSPTEHFRYYLPEPILLRHIKAWIQGRRPVDLAAVGGHEARFPGCRFFGYRLSFAIIQCCPQRMDGGRFCGNANRGTPVRAWRGDGTCIIGMWVRIRSLCMPRMIRG